MVLFVHFLSFMMLTVHCGLGELASALMHPTLDHLMITLLLCAGAYVMMYDSNENEKKVEIETKSVKPRRSRRLAGETVEYRVIK